MFILIFLLLFSFYCPNSFSQSSKFIIISKVNNPKVSPGDSVLINIFITGGYGVDFAKMHVNIPKFLWSENRLAKFIDLPIVENLNTGKIDFGPPSTKVVKGNVTIKLVKDYFNYSDSTTGQIIGELEPGFSEEETYSPISFSFKLSDKAPAGDHKISLALYYQKNGISDIDVDEIEINVMSFWERNELIIQIFLAFMILILGLLFNREVKYKWFWSTILLSIIIIGYILIN